ncbi:hypothetical protein D3C86_2127310 [compost metagenome]
MRFHGIERTSLKVVGQADAIKDMTQLFIQPTFVIPRRSEDGMSLLSKPLKQMRADETVGAEDCETGHSRQPSSCKGLPALML